MRTDAVLFNKRGAEQVNSGRMDCAQKNKSAGDFFATGSAMEKTSKSGKSFQETYREVARSNSSARETTEASTEVRSRRNRTVSDKQANAKNNEWKQDSECVKNEGSFRQMNINSSDSENPECEEDFIKYENSEAQNLQASETIRQALVDVGETLGLNILPGIENVKLDNPDDETVEQISQIVHDLKSIIGALETALANGEEIDTGKKVISLSDASLLLEKLNKELFRIELGVNILGKSSDVQSFIAQKMNAEFTDGIPQAIDPSQIQMSHEQIKKILGKAFSQTENGSSVSQLVKKINEMAGESVDVDGQIKISEISSDVSVNDDGPAEFDSTVYRTMLKIENSAAVVSGNTEAANAVVNNTGINNQAEPVIARDVSVKASDGTEQVFSVTEMAGKSNFQTLAQEVVHTQGSLPKTMEQSVLNQLTEKLDSAIRSGVTEVRVQLRPESLGEVTLKIRIEGDVVTARMQVENQHVKAIVENGLSSLRDSLAQHNLQTGSIEVNIQNGDGGQGTYEQLLNREFAEQKNHKSTDGSGEQEECEEQGDNSIMQEETGRRFGSNTVEFFA